MRKVNVPLVINENLLSQIKSFAVGVQRKESEIIELILNDYFNCTSLTRLLHDTLIIAELELMQKS